MKWRDFRCYVVIDGVKITEYQDLELDSNDKTTSCWVASQGGKDYQVRIKMVENHPGVDLAYDLFIDNEIVYLGLVSGGRKFEKNIRGLQINSTQLKEFRFTRLDTTDERDGSVRNTIGLGTIRLVISRCKLVKGKTALPKACLRPPLCSIERQRSLKPLRKQAFIVHRYSLGKQHVSRPKAHKTLSIPKHADEYYHTFVFKYKPIEYLLAKDIAAAPRRSKRGLPPGEGDSSSEKDHDTIFKRETEEEDGIKEENEHEEIRQLEELQKHLLEEDERMERERQERQQNIRENEEKLSRLKADRSRPPGKRIKLEYQERLKELHGQVFEISD